MFLCTQAALSTLLPKLQRSSIENKDDYTENLLELYKLTGNLWRYFENLHETALKVIREGYQQLDAQTHH